MTEYPPAAASMSLGRGVYFGWRVVLALFLCTFAIFGSSIYSFIVVAQPLAQEQGWSAAQTGGLVSAMWLVAPLALFYGPLTRRFSPWGLILFGLCAEALVLASLIFVTEFWQLYLLRIVMGFGKVLAIAAVPMLTARWFSRRFATAMALVWAGGSTGGLALSPATEALVLTLGWRPATLVVAGGLLAVAVAISLLSRGPSSPTEMGLGLDGDPIAAREIDGAGTARGESGNTQSGDVKAINPWVAGCMFVAVIGAGMASIAVLTQELALLRRAHFSPAAAATLLGMTAGGSTTGSGAIGWMLDRFNARWSALAIVAAIGFGVLALALAPESRSVILAGAGALALGFAFGAGEVLWITLTRRQFGEAVFPVTYGGWYFALQAGYAAGGSLAGWSFDHLGPSGFLVFVALVYLPAAICSLALPAGRQAAPVQTPASQ
jgi:predicted MFS family arabinose efflux permease